MSQYTVFPRSDCDESDPERFTIVAPNGCALPLRPLGEEEANHLTDLLNALFLEE